MNADFEARLRWCEQELKRLRAEVRRLREEVRQIRAGALAIGERS